MILTDREILIALDCGQLEIDPRPSADSYASSSVDLTLSANGLLWEPPGGIQVKPGHLDYKYSSISKSFQKSVYTDGYILMPSAFLLSWTKEKINMPINSRLAARVEGRSSLARLGIGIHLTAPTIHAGFIGPIQLEMFNFGKFEIVLNAGMKICQLIFEQTMGTPQAGYTGQFFDQKP